MAFGTVTEQRSASPRFRVIDALDHPHGGRILRLRLEKGKPPAVKDLKGARLRLAPPEGEETGEATGRVEGFAVFGGRPSDERLRRTGRVDVRVVAAGGEGGGELANVGLRWTAFLNGDRS